MDEPVVVPAEFEHDYSPQIDRFDVAIRAVMRLFRQRNWECLEQLGVNRASHEGVLTVSELYVDDIRADQQVAALLDLCPFLLSAALELLRRYSVLTAMSKREWVKGATNNGSNQHTSGRVARGGSNRPGGRSGQRRLGSRSPVAEVVSQSVAR